MKTLLYFLIFNISAISFAQDPQLFENTWYLQKLIVDGEEYVPPTNGEVEFIPLNIFQDVFDTVVCLNLSGYELTISNTEINVFEFIILLDEACVLSENNDYENLYYNGFFEWQSMDKTFAYIIENQGNGLSLILTSAVGNKAFYGNQQLSIPVFSKPQFSIHPNPVKNELFLSTTNPIDNLKIKIFNIEGELLSNLKLENQTAIDVSNLTSGMYFLNIEDENGNTTIKKFLKE